jgi:hypothetical protein
MKQANGNSLCSNKEIRRKARVTKKTLMELKMTMTRMKKELERMRMC